MNDNEDYTELKDNMLCYAAIVKYPHPESNEVLIRCPYDCDLDDKFSIYAMGFDFSLKVQVWNADSEEFLLVSVEEAIREYLPEILDLPRLTEEEFYQIPTQFTFILNGEPKRYDYKEGMTWGEWIDSPYNDGNFSVHDANMGEGIQEYVHYEYSAIKYNEYYYVKPTDLIQPNMNYVVNNQVE